LNKKRDALRRGIRDLIADATKDLAAFEGREVQPLPAPAPRPPEAGPRDRPPLNGAPAIAPVRPESDGLRAAVAGTSAPPPAPRELVTEPVLFPPAVPPDKTEVPPPAPRAAKPRGSKSRKTRGTRAAKKAADVRARRGGGQRAKPARRVERPRASGGTMPAAAGTAAPVDENMGAGTAPEPAEPRTGVCRSYFVNHECWRVPAAYCNTALQVCVIRSCPVYHLHKDALERRFAKKYKHLW
jgi:hypothetical protein